MTMTIDHPTPAPPARTGCVCLIRPAVAADADALADFAARTFVETYGKDNTEDDLHLHLRMSYSPVLQAREIADEDGTTLVALDGARLAAYAQVRRGASVACVRDAAPVELHRFYVDGTWHGRGLAQRLLDEVRAVARSFGGDCLWLKVWERNPRAIAFYGKCGFVDVGSADFLVGTDRQTDRVLRLELGARG